MRISIFGLGYVGAVSGACLAARGHDVIGVDPVSEKVDSINAGKSPIVEEAIDELIAGVVKSGKFRATQDVNEAIATSDMSWVCVGTPSKEDGSLDTQYVKRVSKNIGEALRGKETYHLVVIRSTVLPGTVDEIVIPTLRASAGRDIDVCFHPEFLREGTSVKDFNAPPKIVIGHSKKMAGQTLASLYQDFEAPLIQTSIRVAEMVKYADNSFHALKVVFGNEIGAICKALDIDSHEVMNIFCQDRKLNISPTYLRPGFAYGGSCLPKDLRALNALATASGVEVPVLSSIQTSNDIHIQRVIDLIVKTGKTKVGLLGLSFKDGTDDLRESPLVRLCEELMDRNITVTIHDENVSIAKLRGGNQSYIDQHLPHMADHLCENAEDLIASNDLIIAGNAANGIADLLRDHAQNKIVIDLVRIAKDDHAALPGNPYVGLCW